LWKRGAKRRVNKKKGSGNHIPEKGKTFKTKVTAKEERRRNRQYSEWGGGATAEKEATTRKERTSITKGGGDNNKSQESQGSKRAFWRKGSNNCAQKLVWFKPRRVGTGERGVGRKKLGGEQKKRKTVARYG